MKRSAIMKGTAVVAMVFGLPLLLAPNELLALYRAPELNTPGVYNSMLYGTCLVAVSVMNWLAADGSDAEARPVVIGAFVLNVLGFAVALLRQLTDQAPPAAWANVVIFLVLGLLYAGLLRGAFDAAPRR